MAPRLLRFHTINIVCLLVLLLLVLAFSNAPALVLVSAATDDSTRRPILARLNYDDVHANQVAYNSAGSALAAEQNQNQNQKPYNYISTRGTLNLHHSAKFIADLERRAYEEHVR